MDDWLKDPLMFLKEGSLSYRTPKSLAIGACQKWKSFHFSTRLKLEGADHFCRLVFGASSMPYELGLPLLAFKQAKWYLRWTPSLGQDGGFVKIEARCF